MTAPTLSPTSESLTIVPDSLGPWGRHSCLPEASQAVPANGQPRTLAEIVDHEAMGYRAWGTPTGEFLARQMERLAQLIRWTGADDPIEHEARMEVWDEEIREQWFDRGYHEGWEAGRSAAIRD